tara:strand:- start:3612 stop:5570 length:1959 start_codon:yes stop_codon:yes gene_type:complete
MINLEMSNKIIVTYNKGPKVEIVGDIKENYFIEFIDNNKKEVIYSDTIDNNMWTSCNKEYYIPWLIKINGKEYSRLELKDQRVLISIDSKAVGDTIAWTPYVVEFEKKHKCKVLCSTFHNEWFKNLEEYKEIEFIQPGDVIDCITHYKIGWFKNEEGEWGEGIKNPRRCNSIPLQATATDILGLEFKELNYGVDLGKSKRPIKDKYVIFGPQATSGCKEWVHDYWCELTNKFIDKGYKIFVCSTEHYNIPNTVDISGDLELTSTYLKYADIFIGLGSGLSWLNWALDKHTYMINGFAEEGHEFTNNLTKITNDKCIKCWNDPVHVFDPGDWNWCPVYKGTKMQHICQKSITPQNVFSKINFSIKDILITIDSNSLGDTIAAMPYINKYKNDNRLDRLTVKMNKKYQFLFLSSYPNIDFIDIVDTKNYNVINIKYDFTTNVQEGFSNDLGYKEFKYIRPEVKVNIGKRPIKNKYVIINVHSTSQLKYWNHPDGESVQNNSPYWSELCHMLRKNNITPVCLELYEFFGESPHYNGLPKNSVRKIGMPLEEVVNYIQHAEFIIGLSSGLAWLTHALGKKVCMIANFTEDWNEMPLEYNDYKRITNKKVCHGCWHTENIDLGDWNTCPKHKNTKRQFECHTSITPKQVFNEIKEWI